MVPGGLSSQGEGFITLKALHAPNQKRPDAGTVYSKTQSLRAVYVVFDGPLVDTWI